MYLLTETSLPAGRLMHSTKCFMAISKLLYGEMFGLLIFFLLSLSLYLSGSSPDQFHMCGRKSRKRERERERERKNARAPDANPLIMHQLALKTHI